MRRKDSGLILKRQNIAFKADAVNTDGTFSGYGSVFGNVDFGGDVVEKGAFKESLKRIKASGDPLPMLWQHQSDKPIGGYDVLEEDDHGLKVGGWLLVDDIPLAKQAHVLMKRRIVKGLSIGYYVEDSSFNDKTGVLTLKRLDLREISPVTFPMNELAGVEDVKQLVKGGKLPTIREFEDFLRDAGFSKTQAAVIASRGLKFADRGEPEAATAGLEAALQSFELPSIF